VLLWHYNHPIGAGTGTVADSETMSEEDSLRPTHVANHPQDDPLGAVHPPPAGARSRSWIPTLALAAVVLVAVTAYVLAAFGYARWSAANRDAMDELHLVCEVVAEHVERERRWPSSWDELAAGPPRQIGRRRWPDDRARLSGSVVIDFDWEISRALEQPLDAFTAVRSPAYMHLETPVVTLFERVQAVARAEHER
jgi:hypothetical protein